MDTTPTGGGTRPVRSTLANDPEMAELVGMFVDELPERVRTLTDALQQNNYELVFRIAHQLKGASAGYGFAVLGAAAGAVEERARQIGPQQDISSLKQQIDAMVALCNRVVR